VGGAGAGTTEQRGRVVVVVSVAVVDSWEPQVSNRRGWVWLAPEVQVQVGESTCSRLSIAEWGFYRVLDLPRGGAWSWVGRAQGGAWGWAGLGWARDGVMGMG
jgi:hypothetical protein